MNKKQLQTTAWALSGIVVGVAVFVWGDLYRWRLSRLGAYQWFPLFGLLAFSLMWAHYIVAVLRQYTGIDKEAVERYFEVTSLAVLVAILLHPGLLIFELWRDGRGLPPGSTTAYVGPALRWALLLGVISWVAFLLYELRHWFSSKPWWKFVQYASDVAMLAIFYHGLRLGSHLRTGWFKGVWFFYGITLVMALVFIYSSKIRQPKA